MTISRNKVYFILFLFLSIIISLSIIVPFSSAVGLMGKKLTVRMDFIPNYEEQYNYYISPTVNYAEDYEVKITGDLADYVTVNKDYFPRVSPNQAPLLTADLKLPNELPPGEHVAKISVIETASPGSAAISVLAGVRGQIFVRSYYPEPYPVFDFRAQSGNEGESSMMIGKIENWGKLAIQDGYLEVIAYDPSGQEIGRMKSDTVNILPGGKKEIDLPFSLDGFGPGMYSAKGIFHSNVEDVIKEDPFQVGSLELFVSQPAKVVYSDIVAPVSFTVRSNWGKPLDGVYTILRINDQAVESPSHTIGAWGGATFKSYVDGTGLTPGPTELEIEMIYKDYHKVEKFPVIVKVPVISQDEKPSPSGFDYFIVFVIILISLFAVINTVLYVKYKRFGEAFH